jgi:IS5 family transposase
VPVFGYKSHIGIDRRHGLIRCWAVTDAAQHDSRSFPALLDPENTASRVWADTAYRTKRNLEALDRRGLSERILFRVDAGYEYSPEVPAEKSPGDLTG